ncbi:hypothetical protein APSETT444_005919 [Aspergillus pseudonomiae]
MSWPNLNFSGKDSFFNEDGGKSYVNMKEDIEMAIEYGVDGVVISNHGERQVDGVPAAIDALRECEPVARRKIQIGLEGGIRRGSDTFKALALGAQHCFVGRVPLWGLAYNGQNGVKLSMKILHRELQTMMALAGDVNRTLIFMRVAN